MKRRNFLAGAGSLVPGATLGFPAPAIAQEIRELKMVTDWPEGFPGLQASAERLAETIGVATGGRIKIEVFSSGKLVRPFETFDAVSAGVADMFHSAATYFDKKSLASLLFCTVPFGLTADELFAWIHHGGGQELWDELYAKFNLKPFVATSTGLRWAAGSTRRSPRRKDLRGCAIGCLGSEARCCGGWEP